MIGLDAGVDDIDINAVPGAVVIDVGVCQSNVVFWFDGFTVTDSLQAPRCVGPDPTKSVNSG